MLFCLYIFTLFQMDLHPQHGIRGGSALGIFHFLWEGEEWRRKFYSMGAWLPSSCIGFLFQCHNSSYIHSVIDFLFGACCFEDLACLGRHSRPRFLFQRNAMKMWLWFPCQQLCLGFMVLWVLGLTALFIWWCPYGNVLMISSMQVFGCFPVGWLANL